MDDFLIRNVRITDGSGKDIYVGDVSWKDGIITAAGDAEGRDAKVFSDFVRERHLVSL